MNSFVDTTSAEKSTSQGARNQVSRMGSFGLKCSADAAFPLFSPEGERHWVKGWDPKPVFPETVEFSRNTVFRTGSGEEEAVWTILNADWQNHHAEYVRVAPTSHAARIAVNVRAAAIGHCTVEVSYTVTAFGEHAAGILAEFSENAYAKKMLEWQLKIGEYLQRHSSGKSAEESMSR